MRVKIEHTLCPQDQSDLTWFWRDADPIIGLRSNMQAQVDALNAASIVDSGVKFEPSSATIYVPSGRHAPRVMERNGLRVAAARRANRIGAILVRLVRGGYAWEECVLYGMYGMEEPPPWHISALGEFSRIVGLTAIARDKSRQELREAVEQSMARVSALKQCVGVLRDASSVYANVRQAWDDEAEVDRARIRESKAHGYLGVLDEEAERKAKQRRYFDVLRCA